MLKSHGMILPMNGIDIESAIRNARELLDKEETLSPALRSAMEVILMLVSLMFNRLGLNSRNSRKPPSTDPNRKRKSRGKGLKRGGQNGHIGTTLKQMDEVDEIKDLLIDRGSLPADLDYTHAGYESRQVVDIDIRRIVTEFRAEVLKDQHGRRYVAPFPEGVTRPVQYGNGIKAHAVYLSQYQLLPYGRIEDYFRDQLHTFQSAAEPSVISIRMHVKDWRDSSHG